MSSSQLVLRYNNPTTHADAWAEILDEIQQIAVEIGPKQVAYDLDVSPSVLSHALQHPTVRDEENRHRFRGEWLLYFLARAKTDRLASLLIRVRGLELAPRRELTAAEKLERLTAAVERNPTLARALYDDAFGPGGRP